jgi:plasmid maintenance system antidote protein VapI
VLAILDRFREDRARVPALCEILHVKYGWSFDRIARLIDVHRATVHRWVQNDSIRPGVGDTRARATGSV